MTAERGSHLARVCPRYVSNAQQRSVAVKKNDADTCGGRSDDYTRKSQPAIMSES